MENIIISHVNTDFKDILLKFNYEKLNSVLFYNGSHYNKYKSNDITTSMSNVSLVSIISQDSLVSTTSNDLERYYPDDYNIFRCFNYFNFSGLKYVILGQDPYHNGQANGLAFSINEGEKQPPSLRTINKEYNRSLNVNEFLTDLSFLARKGVLLLNTALTVENKKPGSHAKLWEPFTQFILQEIDKENIIFFLWGNHAKKYKKFIKKGEIRECGHPSPLNSKNDFIGNNHFLEIK